MADLDSMSFTITVHFGNGVTIDKNIPLKKAVTYATKKNVIIPADADFVEINSVDNSIIIPIHMTFVIPLSPNFKHIDNVGKIGLYKRENGRCAYCGKEISLKESTKDHVIPRSKGGKSTWQNLVLACKPCNSKKDDRTPKEAGMKLNFTPYNPKKKKG